MSEEIRIGVAIIVVYVLFRIVDALAVYSNNKEVLYRREKKHDGGKKATWEEIVG
jgi:hypothetical protein